MKRCLLGAIAALAFGAPANAATYDCAQPQVLIGDVGKNPVVSSTVRHDGATWSVEHKLADGQLIHRELQYNMIDRNAVNAGGDDKSTEFWGGLFNHNPARFMVGEIIWNNGTPHYTERLFDARNDAVVMWSNATCTTTTLAGDPAYPPPSPPPPAPEAPPAREAAPSPKDIGSGVIIDTTKVLTANHVVKSCANITIRSSSGPTIGWVSARDAADDLAVIQTKDQLSNLATFSDGPVRSGDRVVALGYPLAGVLATAANVTVGYVSALAGLNNNPNEIQISAPIQPGNSGGPLFDASGYVVSIVTSKIDDIAVLKGTGSLPQNVNFAVKGETARDFLRSNNIWFDNLKSNRQMSPADVGDIGRPSTVKIECLGGSDDQADAAPPPSQDAPAPTQPWQPRQQPVNVLPMCEAPQVTPVLKRIGLQMGVAVFKYDAGTMSRTPDMEFCRAVAWTSAGKRVVNYTITWLNRATNQFNVRVTWCSGQMW
jgi:S1-C subfamily serine protease